MITLGPRKWHNPEERIQHLLLKYDRLRNGSAFTVYRKAGIVLQVGELFFGQCDEDSMEEMAEILSSIQAQARSIRIGVLCGLPRTAVPSLFGDTELHLIKLRVKLESMLNQLFFLTLMIRPEYCRAIDALFLEKIA